MWIVHASTRGPVDAGWTPAAQLSSVGADAYESSPAIDDTGEAVVGWTRGDPAGPIVWTAFKPFSGAWQPAVNMSPPGSVGTDILVWDENGRGRWAMRSPASGAWSASASFPTSTVQELVVSGSGDVLASWEGDGITAVEMQAGTATWGQPFLGLVAAVLPDVLRGPVRRRPIDFTAVRFRWLFGDGRSATGQRVTHVYRRPGRYAVTLVATDAAGHTATVAKTSVRVTARRG